MWGGWLNLEFSQGKIKHLGWTFENDNPDPDCPRKNEKAKKFWSFVKSLKKDASGINTLRENGILKTDTLDKADICNRQLQSAFSRESDDEIPSKGTSPFTAMGEITVFFVFFVFLLLPSINF